MKGTKHERSPNPVGEVERARKHRAVCEHYADLCLPVVEAFQEVKFAPKNTPVKVVKQRVAKLKSAMRGLFVELFAEEFEAHLNKGTDACMEPDCPYCEHELAKLDNAHDDDEPPVVVAEVVKAPLPPPPPFTELPEFAPYAQQPVYD